MKKTNQIKQTILVFIKFFCKIEENEQFTLKRFLVFYYKEKKKEVRHDHIYYVFTKHFINDPSFKNIFIKSGNGSKRFYKIKNKKKLIRIIKKQFEYDDIDLSFLDEVNSTDKTNGKSKYRHKKECNVDVGTINVYNGRSDIVQPSIIGFLLKIMGTMFSETTEPLTTTIITNEVHAINKNYTRYHISKYVSNIFVQLKKHPDFRNYFIVGKVDAKVFNYYLKPKYQYFESKEIEKLLSNMWHDMTNRRSDNVKKEEYGKEQHKQSQKYENKIEINIPRTITQVIINIID